MPSELLEALSAIQEERGIDKEVLIEAIETALISAYKKNYATNQNIKINFDRESGDINVFGTKTVVNEVYDEAGEMLLEDAKKIDPEISIGDDVDIEITPKSFGRIAAQMAKQVVIQRIREAERGIIYNEYLEKENELLSGVVHRVEKNAVYVELGKTEGIMTMNEIIPGEVLKTGKRIKVYVLQVKKSSKGPQIMLSRTHPTLVKRMFEMEVPEIQNGIVQIKNIAREAGYRTKMAVYSNDADVDCVGACVGHRGMRVEAIVSELNGEKIDIIRWSADPVEYISNALSPTKVLIVSPNEKEKIAKVIVPDNQLSLAIGKEGQNARLAAKLTGWKIDIKSQTDATEDFMGNASQEETEPELPDSPDSEDSAVDESLKEEINELTDELESDIEDIDDIIPDDIEDIEDIDDVSDD